MNLPVLYMVLLRVRAFTQDDAHIFCTEDQITNECLSITNLILEIYKDLGFTNVFATVFLIDHKKE